MRKSPIPSLLAGAFLLLLCACGKESRTVETIPADPLFGAWTTGWYEIPISKTATQKVKQSYEFYPDGVVKYAYETAASADLSIRFYSYRYEGTYTTSPEIPHSLTKTRKLDITKKAEYIMHFGQEESDNRNKPYGIEKWEDRKWVEITARDTEGNIKDSYRKYETIFSVKDSTLFAGESQQIYPRDDYPTERAQTLEIDRPFRKQ